MNDFDEGPNGGAVLWLFLTVVVMALVGCLKYGRQVVEWLG